MFGKRLTPTIIKNVSHGSYIKVPYGCLDMTEAFTLVCPMVDKLMHYIMYDAYAFIIFITVYYVLPQYNIISYLQQFIVYYMQQRRKKIKLHYPQYHV